MRLEEHRGGKCATTTKMAAKHRVPLSDLRAHVMRTWRAESTEGRVMRLCRTLGMARWNHPYAFSSGDGKRGGAAKFAMYGNTYKFSDADRRRGKRTSGARRAVALAYIAKHGSPLLNWVAKHGNPSPFKNPNIGRLGGRKGNHIRWHLRRGMRAEGCSLCEVAA